MNSINILGTEYGFRVDEQVMNDAGADGMCRFHSKEIILRPEENILEDGTEEETVPITTRLSGMKWFTLHCMKVG